MALTLKQFTAMLLLASSILSNAPSAHGLGQTLSIGGGQFITYEGSLSGSFTFSDPRLSTCGDLGTFYFSKEGNATMRIGVNPPIWDKNPFYFELIREGSVPSPQPTPTQTPIGDDEISTRPRPTGGRSISLPTAQPSTGASRRQVSSLEYEGLGTVFNLHFQSASYECLEDRVECRNPPAKPSDAVVTQLLNLGKASTTVVNERVTLSDGGPYYSVRGDAATLVSNGTKDVNSFDSQTPSNYTSGRDSECRLGPWPKIIW